MCWVIEDVNWVFKVVGWVFAKGAKGLPMGV